MIPKNLKVGDTFVDEFKFEVVKVNSDGTYISRRITNESVKKSDSPVEEMAQPSRLEDVPQKITPEPVNFTKTQVNRMPNSELEKVCKELGLEIGTGTEMKRAIIAKLGL